MMGHREQMHEREVMQARIAELEAALRDAERISIERGEALRAEDTRANAVEERVREFEHRVAELEGIEAHLRQELADEKRNADAALESMNRQARGLHGDLVMEREKSVQLTDCRAPDPCGECVACLRREMAEEKRRHELTDLARVEARHEAGKLEAELRRERILLATRGERMHALEAQIVSYERQIDTMAEAHRSAMGEIVGALGVECEPSCPEVVRGAGKLRRELAEAVEEMSGRAVALSSLAERIRFEHGEMDRWIARAGKAERALEEARTPRCCDCRAVIAFGDKRCKACGDEFVPPTAYVHARAEVAHLKSKLATAEAALHRHLDGAERVPESSEHDAAMRAWAERHPTHVGPVPLGVAK